MNELNSSSESRLRKLFDNSADAFIVLNTAGIIEEWNRCAESTFGWRAADVLGKSLSSLILPSPSELNTNYPFAFLTTKSIPAKCVEFIAQTADQRSLPIEMTVTKIETFTQDEYFVTLRDISARKLTEEALMHNANHDAHTGLPNRGLFNLRLKETMARAMRSTKTAALFFLDIDHFKSINDSMGHEAGDAVLKQFAAILKASVRQTDFVARYGGDEFTIVVEGVKSTESVVKVANNILNAMRQANWPGDDFKIGTSIGIAIYDKRESDPNKLIKMADQAMYKAKHSGRNTYKIYSDGHNADLGPKKIEGKITQAKALFSSTREEKPEFLQHVLASIRSHLDMDVAFISRFHDGVREFEVVDSGHATAPIAVGDSGPLEESYCQRVIDGRLPEIICDAFDQPEAMRLPVTVALPVRAHMSVPIRKRDGSIYGTFCCFSYRPNQSLNERDIAMMHVLADLVGDRLN